MSSKTLISVIVPTYNRADYISESLDSVFNQNLPNDTSMEVIVVDDGSTDKTGEIIKTYGNKLKYFKIEHSGKPAKVRNVALEHTSGDLIAFQDSDDIWSNDKLIKSIPEFNNPDIVGVYGNAGYIDANGNKIPNKAAIAPGAGLSGDIFFYLTSRNKPSFPTPTIILRRSVMDKVGPFNEKLIIATDTEYWIRYSTQGNFKFIDDTLCSVRRHTDNISSVPSEGGLQALYKHEVNRINMYEQIINGGLLNDGQVEALDARIVELNLYVSDLASRLSHEKSNEHKARFGVQYKETLKKYYGHLPTNVTSMGLSSRIKRALSVRFPSLYQKAAKFYKSIRGS